MLTLLLPALSATVALASEGPVLVKATPFELSSPANYTMQQESFAYSTGVLLQLQVQPAEMLRPLQTVERVLYIGDRAAVRFNWDHVGGCAVIAVPGPVDLSTAEIYFSEPLLPQRATPQSIASQRQLARSRGARAPSAATVQSSLSEGGPALTDVSYSQLHESAMQWVASCSKTPEDHQRAGIR